MTRRSLVAVLALALAIDGCACAEGDSGLVDAAFDPSLDARARDAWERVDASRDDAGPDAYDSAEDPCVTAPRSAACAREQIRGIDAAFCDAERACGRPITEEGCEIWFPPEGAALLRASEDELTLVRLGLLEIAPETVACLRERMATCSHEDPDTCGPLFRSPITPTEGQRCWHQDQCGPDLRCDGLYPGPPDPVGLCGGGTCRPRLADGEPCVYVEAVEYPSMLQCRVGSACIDGTCAPLARPDPVGLRERCGLSSGPDGFTFTRCREGLCRTITAETPETCMPVVAIGEDCTDAWCGADAACRDGQCVARVRLGDPCVIEGGICDHSAFGSACVDGVCVANQRGIGDPCEINGRQPCVEGVCVQDASSREDYSCQPPLRSPIGGLCRRSDRDCLDGVCCAGMCVSLGGIS